MPMRIAPSVKLNETERAWLLKQTRSGVASKRCEIVLLAAADKSNEKIAAALKITRQRAGRWRTRYVDLGRVGIEADAPGRGRKPT